MYTLITGASSGIGEALVLECASRGMNVLLVALPGEELNVLQEKIRNNYKVKCHSFGIDLSVHCSSSRVYEWVMQNNYKVNILINNVGVGSKGAFDQLSPDFYYVQMNLNMVTTCILSRLFIEELKANSPAYLLNVGSLGGFFLMPNKAVYSASKAFVYSFSRCLRMELKSTGISVSVLCPGGTDSNTQTTAINKELRGIAKASILMPDYVAKVAITEMLKGKARIIPGFVNQASYHLGRIIPEFIKTYFIARTFRHLNKHQY